MAEQIPAQNGLTGYFVTGTDTDVGKTLIAAGLLVAATQCGMRTVGIKPVAAGCVPTTTTAGVTRVHDDALALQQAASVQLDYASVNPVALERQIAPHIAAADSGIDILAGDLVQHCHRVGADSEAEFMIIEGVGGWLVPLNETETMADFCVALAFPVIVVVGMKLGCLNHALLTVQAVQASGLSVAGWVANCVVPEMAAFDENLQTLTTLLSAPLLGVVPYLGATATAAQAAGFLQCDLLLRAGT